MDTVRAKPYKMFEDEIQIKVIKKIKNMLCSSVTELQVIIALDLSNTMVYVKDNHIYFQVYDLEAIFKKIDTVIKEKLDKNYV